MTKTRLETFSDGVIAIVITLLAIELNINMRGSSDNSEALQGLQHLVPEIFIFVLSFITISIMWINHHYITSKIENVNYKTVWSNTMLLMCITLIPFATTFLGNNPNNQVALIVYSVIMLASSLAFTLLKYTSVPRDAITHHKEIFKHVGVYAYTFAIFVALFMPPLTYFVLLVPPLSYLLPGRE